MENKQIIRQEVFFLGTTVLEYFKNLCKEDGLEYSDELFEKFIEFLKIDIPNFIRQYEES